MRQIDIDSWLRELGLECYVESFLENDIDAETLCMLTDADLEELGVASVGHRRKILSAIAGLMSPDAVPEPLDVARGSAPHFAVMEGLVGERRTVTILFCDIADFTRLSSELDAEDAHTLLNNYFEVVDSIVKRYGGHVDKHIGDTVMAVFGAPIAHTNDPERAVRTAFEIRNAVRYLTPPIRVHTGIASGSVVASHTGSHTHLEYTVTGHAVNLAARLHDLAGPHEILMSESVKRAVAPWIESTAIHDVMLKGVDEAVEVWRLDGLRSDSGERVRTPLVGRTTEIETIAALLARCRTQKEGQVVHIRGEAGMGKTRLVEELCAMARIQGYSCHVSHVLDFGHPLGPISELVSSLLSLGSMSTASERREAVRTAEFLGLVPKHRDVYLNDLLDVPQPGAQRRRYDALSPAHRDRGKRETVAELIAHRAAKRPQLIVIEDVHWADAEVSSHVEHLIRSIARVPVLLCLTSRREGHVLAGLDHDALPSTVVAMELLPLAPAEALALAQTFVDAEPGFLRSCVERAEGNPLFLEQLLRTTGDSSADVLPGSIQSIVQARIDHLDSRDKHALQAAAVLGQRFTLSALRAVIIDPEYTCDSLVAHQLVCPEGDEYVFVHALVLEGVYSSLLKTRQKNFHLAAAAFFARTNALLAAEHLDRAEAPEAAAAYLSAARAQAADYRFERAEALCGRGLALLRERPSDAAQAREVEYELLRFRAELLRILGALPESIAESERALALAPDEVARCLALIGKAQVLRVAERGAEALAISQEAHAIASARGLTGELAAIHCLRGNLLFFHGDIDGCLREHTRALDYARAVGSVELEAQALSGLGDAYYMRARMISAHDQFTRCIELCRDNGLGSIEVANLSLRGVTRYYQNDLYGGLSDGADAARVAAWAGHKRAELVARSGCTGWILTEMCCIAEAREEFQIALDIARSLGTRRFESIPLIFLGRLLAMEDRMAEARVMIEQGVASCHESSAMFLGSIAFSSLALVAPDPAAQHEALAQGEALLVPGSMSHNYLCFYRDAMDVALSMGDPELVKRYASALEAYTRSEPLPWSKFFVARGRALAACVREPMTSELYATLQGLHAQAQDVGMHAAARALAQALAHPTA